jgi:hypothetical protein
MLETMAFSIAADLEDYLDNPTEYTPEYFKDTYELAVELQQSIKEIRKEIK